MTKDSPSHGTTSAQVDRRSEPRERTSGEVLLYCAGPSDHVVSGQLVDISASGFRAAHQHPGLSSGEVIAFRHAQAAGQARVIWSRIVPGEIELVESGFFVIALDPC